MRRLLAFLYLTFLAESTLETALAPLLPHYATALGLSGLMTGVLTAAYPFGLIAGALASHFLVARLGPHVTLIGALTTFALGTLMVALATVPTTLVAARTIQGAGCGCIWVAGVTWLTLATPSTRRGTLLGLVYSAPQLGTIAGPAVGTVALLFGPGRTFGVAAGVVLIIALLAFITPPATASQTRPALTSVLRRPMRLPLALVLLATFPLGLLTATVPLRLAALGATDFTIAMLLLLAGITAAVTIPVTGMFSDRRGGWFTVCLGIAFMVPSSAILGLSTTLAASAVLAIVALGIAVPLAAMSAIALLATTADAEHAATSFQPPMLVAIASGQVLGSFGGSALAAASTYAVPYLVLAGVNVAVAIVVTRPSLSIERRSP
jgi:MFS family permease